MLIFIKMSIAIVFSAIIPLSAISFFQFRLKRKKKQYESVLETLGVNRKQQDKVIPSVSGAYRAVDYLAPVTFAFLVSFTGNAYLMFTEEIFDLSSKGSQSLLLSGMFMGSPENSHQFQMQATAVIAFALVGGYLWSTQNIIRRIIANDLSPGVYYRAGMRMTLAALTALMVFFVTQSGPQTEVSIIDTTMPGLAFLIGMFPDRGLRLLQSKIAAFRQKEEHLADSMPLQMIEGISSFQMDRLQENSIDDVQNLAETHLEELLVKTPFPVRQLVDWIAQAKLTVYFKEDVIALRKAGIRTIFDLIAAGDRPGDLEKVATTTGIAVSTLERVHDRVSKNREARLLQAYAIKLSEAHSAS